MIEDFELSPEEEQEVEPLANIYSLIRTLEFIEWAYNFGHITQEVRLEQGRQILNQYYTLVDAYQEQFENINDFCKKYDLTDCRLAIKKISEGYGRNDSGFGNAMELAQRFSDISNLFFLKPDPSVCVMIGDITPLFSDLVNCLNKCSSIFPPNIPDIMKVFQWFNVIKSRKAAEFLTREEEEQIKLDLNVAYETIQKYLNNRQ